MSASGTPCHASSTVSFSGQRVAAIRARRSSRSASRISIVNGRIAVTSTRSLVMTDMWVSSLGFVTVTKPAAKLGGTEWLRVEPPGRAAERGHTRTSEHGHLAKRPEARSDLVAEQLRLLPSREVPALVDPVEVDEIGVGLLRPTPRHLIELIGKAAHRDRDGDALRTEEGELVLPIQTPRRDPRVRQPVVGDVVEDVVSREALGLSVEDTCDQRQTSRVVVEHPGGQADGRIRNSVQRLWMRRQLEC